MTYDKFMIKSNSKVISRKGLKISTVKLDMRGVPSHLFPSREVGS